MSGRITSVGKVVNIETVSGNNAGVNPLKSKSIMGPDKISGIERVGRFFKNTFARPLAAAVLATSLLACSTPIQPDGVAIEAQYDTIWVKQAGGPHHEEVRDAKVFEDGSSMITGAFTDNAIFGKGESNQITLRSVPDPNQDPPQVISDYDIFVAKYNPNGTLAWAKRAGGKSRDIGENLALLSDGSVLLSGSVCSASEEEPHYPVLFGEGELNETDLSDPHKDTFIAKYNPDGTLAWAKLTEVGRWISPVITAFGENSFLLGHPDLNVANYALDGTLLWTKSLTDSGTPHTSVSAICGSSGGDYFVVSGNFEGTAVFGEGEPNETTLQPAASDIPLEYGEKDMGTFIAKYNPDGTLAWAKDSQGADVKSIKLSADNSIILAGTLFGFERIFGEGEPNQTILSAAHYEDMLESGAGDVLIAKYNPDGTLLWAKQAGGEACDRAFDLALHKDGSISVVGQYSHACTVSRCWNSIFGEGEPNETVMEFSKFSAMFLAKYYSNGNLIKAVRIGGTEGICPEGVGVLPDDSVLIAGGFAGTHLFVQHGSEGIELIGEQTTSLDMFVGRFAYE